MISESDLPVIWWIVFCPYVTFVVDWALNVKHTNLLGSSDSSWCIKGLYSVVCVKLMCKMHIQCCLCEAEALKTCTVLSVWSWSIKDMCSVVCAKLVHKGMYSVVCMTSGWTWMPGLTSLSLTAVMKRRLLSSGSSLLLAQMNTGQLEMSSSFFPFFLFFLFPVIGF